MVDPSALLRKLLLSHFLKERCELGVIVIISHLGDSESVVTDVIPARYEMAMSAAEIEAQHPAMTHPS